MKHRCADDAAKETAALYAMGALTQLEASAFDRHLAEGCETCTAELRMFDSVVDNLGFAAACTDPPSRLREKLLDSLDGGTAQMGAAKSRPAHLANSKPELLTVRANEGEWKETATGVFVKRLFADEASGTVTTMVRMLPGASLPMHRHLGIEQCLMLDGDFHVNEHVFRKGDYHCAPKGSVHETLFTENGALFLIVSQKGFEVVDPV
jgi:anti-sigma factor ChrR (cupin superfamily)